MMGLQGMRGREGRGQFPTQPGRGGMGPMGMGIQQDRQSSGYGGGRGRDGGMGQPPMMQPSAGAPSALDSIMSAPAQNQKQMLGEALYPKILAINPGLAGKITGMLLEMDNSELFGL